MDDLRKGYTFWARKTITSDIFINKPDKWFKIWFYIVNRVNWKEGGDYDRGSCFLDNDEIARSTRATIDQVKKALAFMRHNEMIGTRRSTRGYEIKVLNFAKYQSNETYKSTSLGTRKAPEKHQRSTTIVEEGKKGRREELTTNIEPPLASQVVKEKKQKELTSLQLVVNHFCELQGMTEAQRNVAYPRHTSDAKALLQACEGDTKKAKAVLDALHAWAASKKLTYTIGTALKRWKDFSGSEVTESWDDKMKRVEAEVEKYKLENGIL